MLNVDILKDETLSETVNKFISGMLPHENYDATFFSTILSSLHRYILLEEFSMEYYVILKALNEMQKLNGSFVNYKPNMSRKVFDDIISASLSDSITSRALRVEEFLGYEGLPNNLEIETTKQIAVQKLYERSMNLYDECFDLAIPSCDVPNFLTELKVAFVGHIGINTINAEARILQSSYRLGHKVYTGVDDWILYTKESMLLLTERLKGEVESDGTQNVLQLNSIENARILHDSLLKTAEVLCPYGIPQLDDYTPMLRHRLVVIVAKENVGKTTIVINNAAMLLVANRRVVFMCGETPKGKIYAKILSSYIYRKYNKWVLMSHILDSSNCPEEIQKCIAIAEAEILESGNLILIDTLSYDDVYGQLVELYDRYKFDAIFIDHSAALTGGKKLDNPIGTLGKESRAFKRNYPCYVCITSHPGSEAKKQEASNKPTTVSITRGSSVLGEEADETFYIQETEALARQGLLNVNVYKRRDGERPPDFVIKKYFDVAAFEYEEKYQANDTKLSASAEQVLEDLQERYGESEDAYILQ